MAGVSRYNAGGDETDIQKNKLGVKNAKELEDLETALLTDSYDHFIELLSRNKLTLDLNLLFKIHDYFLGPLYSWAGKIRTVNISKGDAYFAPAQNIESALKQFEAEFKKTMPKYEAVDFNKIPDEEFINACRHGMLKNYEPMERLYLKLLRKFTK